MPYADLLSSVAIEPDKVQPKPAKAHFALTIFLSAFLLFWVQLLLGKYILPWFGGTPAVWTACMLFFQLLLLGGYTYAHVLTSRFSPRAQSTLHSVFILVSLLLLAALTLVWSSPITPGSRWKPHSSDHPIWRIVTLLTVSVGLPYFILSSTGPLLQAWLRRTHLGDSPYRLYALSNLGSFLALLSYPFLLEPWLTLKTQARLWSCGYLGFAMGCGYCALRVRGRKVQDAASFEAETTGEASATEGVEVVRPSKGTYVLWLSLAGCASVMFLATTNQICQDIGVVPLLWALPLSLYLLSFIICFEKERWYSRRWFHPAFGLAIFMACFVLYDGALRSITAQIGIYSFVLFTCCMVCHGELVRCKPSSRYLTSFYLTVATGGAFGGVFVALLAPHLFRGFWEYQLGLWASTVLVLLIVIRDKESWLYRSRFGSPVLIVAGASLLPESAALTTAHTDKILSHFPALTALVLTLYVLTNRKQTGFDQARRRAAPVYCAAASLLLGIALFGSAIAHVRNALALSRNFYGVLAVLPQNTDEPDRRAYALKHGRILHGFQFRAEAKRRLPTAYFGPTSGVGLALLHHSRSSVNQANRRNFRIGIVGLGVGTIAAYGQAGDTIRFYEINPEVIRIASDGAYFSYLKDSLARIDVIPGDARLSMERELDRGELQEFDLLAIDAFSGDAIPVHLLTREALEIYLKQLRKPGGVLAVHITNSYLDLKPVIFRVAEHFGLRTAWVHSSGDGRTVSESDWMLLSQDSDLPNSALTAKPSILKEAHLPAIRLWTDDYSNLFQVLKR